MFFAFRLGASSAGPAPADARVEKLADDMAELQQGVSRLSRSLERVGAATGANALALARPALAEPAGRAVDPGEAEQAEVLARVAAHRDNEKQHYARLDDQIRRAASPGAAAAVQLRRNLEVLRALPAAPDAATTVEGFDCTDTLCRVSIKFDGRRDGARMRSVYQALSQGMAELSSAPGAGERAVLYLAANGATLPPLAP